MDTGACICIICGESVITTIDGMCIDCYNHKQEKEEHTFNCPICGSRLKRLK